MPPTAVTWREIEAALREVFRKRGASFDQYNRTGDIQAHHLETSQNITTLAKDLEQELMR